MINRAGFDGGAGQHVASRCTINDRKISHFITGAAKDHGRFRRVLLVAKVVDENFDILPEAGVNGQQAAKHGEFVERCIH